MEKLICGAKKCNIELILTKGVDTPGYGDWYKDLEETWCPKHKRPIHTWHGSIRLGKIEQHLRESNE